MVKANAVLHTLDIEGSGIYCFLPFEKLDSKGKAVFKIGMTNNFYKRTEGYHTYFPLGMYLVAFIVNPTKNKNGYVRESSYYQSIERFIFGQLTELGSKVIYSSTRVKHKIDDKGVTEWVYTDEKSINKVFANAHAHFGGTLKLYNLNGINKDAEILEKRKPNYVGEIVFAT